MAMSKKDFIALADAIKAHNAIVDGLNPAIKPLADRFSTCLINSLADVCAASNPKFNRQRWLDYIAGRCGANGGKAVAK